MTKFFNRYCLELWAKWSLGLLSVFSVIMIFVEISEEQSFIKWIIFGGLVAILAITYVIIYLVETRSKTVKLFINQTEVNILFGDIFERDEKKVIAFNEYFDTQVDDIIIAKRSLNGQVLEKGYIDKDKFDALVANNPRLVKGDLDSKRYVVGKQQKYKLGQIQPYGDYFALALTHFTDDNKAYLYSNEYTDCLLEMWRQLNTYYALYEINIPLLGGSITRMLDDVEVSNQELLETMLQTLKISKVRFKGSSKINIILYPGKNNEFVKQYDLIRIKSIFRR